MIASSFVCCRGVQGIGVLDVIVLQRGEAIVLFNTVMDSHMALQRDR